MSYSNKVQHKEIEEVFTIIKTISLLNINYQNKSPYGLDQLQRFEAAQLDLVSQNKLDVQMNTPFKIDKTLLKKIREQSNANDKNGTKGPAPR